MGQTIPVLGKIEVQNTKIGLKLRSMYPLYRNWELYVIFFQSNPKFGKNHIFSPRFGNLMGQTITFWEIIGKHILFEVYNRGSGYGKIDSTYQYWE